jgi:transcriptional regulator with XRE-family HTH domain
MKQTNDPLAQFGLRIRERREALRDDQGRRISQERFSDLVGFHRTYIGNIERGKVNVSFSNILIIAEGLDIDPGDLLKGLHT